MNDVEVSVIICVRNGAKTLRRQLDALDAQVDYPPFEVLVVDNASADRTADEFRQWRAARGPATCDARLIRADARPSIPYARNRGALAARGRVFAYCDADDRVHPRWVGALHRALADEGMVGGRIEAVSPSGQPLPRTFPHGLTSTEFLPHAGNCNLAITRRCFADLGGYDESLPRYGFEDVDICWRAQERGYSLTYCPDAIIYFSLSPKIAAVRKEFLIAQGRVAMSRRHPHAFQGFTLARCLTNFGAQLVMLPWLLLRPGDVSRSRHIRDLVVAAGFIAGYVIYGRGRKQPALLKTSQFSCYKPPCSETPQNGAGAGVDGVTP